CIGVALDGQEALDGVADVLSGQLAPVDGRLVVPADALAEPEDIGGLVGLSPRLREIALEGEGARGHRRARLVLEEPAVGEAHQDVRLERHGEHVIEMWRIGAPDGQGAAALWRLRDGGTRGEVGDGGRSQRPASRLEKISPVESATMGSLMWLWFLSSPG